MSVWYSPYRDELILYFEEYWAGFMPTKEPQKWLQFSEDKVVFCCDDPQELGWTYIGEFE